MIGRVSTLEVHVEHEPGWICIGCLDRFRYSVNTLFKVAPRLEIEFDVSAYRVGLLQERDRVKVRTVLVEREW